MERVARVEVREEEAGLARATASVVSRAALAAMVALVEAAVREAAEATQR